MSEIQNMSFGINNIVKIFKNKKKYSEYKNSEHFCLTHLTLREPAHLIS